MTDEKLSDGTLIICSPSDMPNVIDGSVEKQCADCEQGIYVAPSGLLVALTAPKPVQFVCIRCGHDRIARDPNPKLKTPTAEQMNELEQHFERRRRDA